MMVSAYHFEGIGRVAVACARLEFEQSTLTGALLASDPAVRDSLVSPGESFGRLQQVARTLAAARFGTVEGSRHPHPLAVELNHWMTAAKRLVERRNTYLHGLWGTDQDQQTGVMTLRRPHQSLAVTLADLNQLQHEIDELVIRLNPILERVVAEVLARERVVLDVIAGAIAENPG